MRPTIEFKSHIIVITSRGILDFLTFGRWRRTCTLDFSRRFVEEQTIRLKKVQTATHHLQSFDAVDYSYQLVATSTKNGVTHDHEEFNVGLRFTSNGKLFPLAAFRGSSESFDGLPSVFTRILPNSCLTQNVRHETEARSLANLLGERLQLPLAI